MISKHACIKKAILSSIMNKNIFRGIGIFIIYFLVLSFGINKVWAGCIETSHSTTSSCSYNGGEECYCFNGGRQLHRQIQKCDLCQSVNQNGTWCGSEEWGYWCTGYVDNNDCNASECSGACFLSGTKVATPGGEKAIEKMKVGDKIMSFDPVTQKQSVNTVAKNYVRDSGSYYIIKTASGKEVKVTGEHPFYVGKNIPLTFWEKMKELVRKITGL